MRSIVLDGNRWSLRTVILLNPLAVSHPQWLYNLLFRCVSETLLDLARIGVRVSLDGKGAGLAVRLS